MFISNLGVDGYGLYSVFGVMLSCLTILDFGIPQYILKISGTSARVGFEEEKLANYLPVAIKFLVASSAVAVFVSLLYGSTVLSGKTEIYGYSSTDVFILTIVIAAGISSKYFENLYGNVLLGLNSQLYYNTVVLLGNILKYGGGVFLLLFVSKSATILLVIVVLVSIFTSLLFFKKLILEIPNIDILNRENCSFSYKQILNGSIPFWFASIIAIALMQSDKLLLSYLVDLKSFGYYMFSWNMSSMIILLTIPINQYLFPKVCGHIASNDTESLKKLIHISTQCVTILFGSITFSIIFNLDFILGLWLNDQDIIRSISPVIRILMVANLLAAIVSIPLQTTLASQSITKILKLNCFILPFYLLILYYLVKEFEIEGAAFSWLLLYVFYILFSVKFTAINAIEITLMSWYIRDIAIPIFSTVPIIYIGSCVGDSLVGWVYKIFAIVFSVFISALISILVTPSLKDIVFVSRKFGRT